LVMKLRRFDLMKLETENVKSNGSFRKINAILLNININRPKLVNMCRYKLATYRNFFYRNILNLSENIAKSFSGGATFLTHTVDVLRIHVPSDVVKKRRRINIFTFLVHYRLQLQ